MGGAENPQGRECSMYNKVGVNVSQDFLFKPTPREPSEKSHSTMATFIVKGMLNFN